LLLIIIIFRHTLVYLDYKQVFVNIAHMINDLETIEERLKSVESNNVYDNGDDNDNNYNDDDDNDFKDNDDNNNANVKDDENKYYNHDYDC